MLTTTINTKTAGQIRISSDYIGGMLTEGANAIVNASDDGRPNSHNHKITFELANSKSIPLWFWGAIDKPKIETDEENIHVLYVFLKFAEHGKMSFAEFCDLRDETGETSELNYGERQKFFVKYNEMFDCEIAELITEIEANYCNPSLISWSIRIYL